MDCSSLDVEVERPGIGRVRLRRASPQDKRALEEFLSRLSKESIYHRFFRLIKDYGEVVNKMLSGETLLCIVAERDGSIIGCAELYKTARPNVGEPAVSVLDEYQGRGLGKILVFMLAHCALQLGIEKFRAYTFKDNVRVMRIASHLNPHIVDDLGDAFLYEMDIASARSHVEDYLRARGLPVDDP